VEGALANLGQLFLVLQLVFILKKCCLDELVECRCLDQEWEWSSYQKKKNRWRVVSQGRIHLDDLARGCNCLSQLNVMG